MGIEDFLPFYVKPSSDDLERSIYAKKEFYDNRLIDPSGREFVRNSDLLKYQQLISRLMSQYTPYNRLLLHHEMGAGKTRSAIATVELATIQATALGKKMEPALVLLKNRGLINKFIRELIVKAEPNKYRSDDYDPDDPLSRMSCKKVRKFYDIQTFLSFALSLDTEERMAEAVRKYSGRVIVIDEVQQLVGEKKRGNVNPYETIKEFLHRVRDVKILLMSGTPMKDTPDQLAMVMNLLLSDKEQLPTGKAFHRKYFNGVHIKPEAIPELQAKFKGKISYLSPPSNVPTVFMGERLRISDIGFMKVVEDVMSSTQENTYVKYAGVEDPVGNFHRPDRYAADFVFPGGSIGNEGLKKFVGPDQRLIPKFRKQLIGDGDDEGKLQRLSRYSAKFASTIRQILEHPDELTFVYSEYVAEGGVLLFSIILSDIFGFGKVTDVVRSERPRYVLITGDVPAPRINELLEKVVNKPENMLGGLCRVVIASRAIALGYDLYNVRQIHILTPHWNFSETDQIIARGRRFDGNKALKDAGYDDVLKVYLHAAVPSDKEVPSIDIQMYEISEAKDYVIKQLERIEKTSAIDCGLLYNTNHREVGTNTRACDYQSCDYECLGLGIPQELNKEDIERTTYQLYYQQPMVDAKIEDLKSRLRTVTRSRFDSEQDPPFLTSKALADAFNDTTPFVNKYGLIMYPRTDGRFFFGVDTPQIGIEPELDLSWYSANPILEKSFDLTDILRALPDVQNRVDGVLDSLEYIDSVADATEMLKTLPTWVYADVIKQLWSNILKTVKKGTWSVDSLRRSLRRKNMNVLLMAFESTLGLTEIYSNRVVLNLEGQQWFVTSDDLNWKIQTAKETTARLRDAQEPYRERALALGVDNFGILTQDEYSKPSDLKIVDAHNPRSPGNQCHSYKTPKLLKLLMDLEIYPPDEEDAKALVISECGGNSKKALINCLREIDTIAELERSTEVSFDLNTYTPKQLTAALWWLRQRKLKDKACLLILRAFEEKGLLLKLKA